MKTKFSLVSVMMLVVCFLPLKSSGQEIIPIPADSTSEWRITRYGMGSDCVDIYNSLYYVNGTTFINNKEYYQIYETGEFHQEFLEPGAVCDDEYEYEEVLRGYIRTENGKVYYYDGWYEYLLLDFTLNVGDIMTTYISPGLIIGSIDSVWIGDQYRKRFNFSNSFICHWMIEGVGHELGLFEPMFLYEGGSTFHCYGENNIPLYGELDCILNVGLEDTYSLKSDVNIYPNPASSVIKIITPENETIEEAIIYNHLGQKALEAVPANNTVDVSKLRPGIYFIEVITSESRAGTKLVVE